MSSFLVDLWESIFTPGPTPTLLLATNATFGTLQLVLLALLFTTSSIHFAILSVLCAGLWYSINWFAREVQAAKAAEEASGGISTKDNPNNSDTRQTSPDPTGSDTETEADHVIATGANPTRTTPSSAQPRRRPPPPQPGQAPMPPPTTRPAVAAPTSSPPSRTVETTSKPAAVPSPATKSSTTAQHLSPNPPTSAAGVDGSQDLSAGAIGRRRLSVGDSSGYVSTDSEWEKVSEQEGK